MTYMMSSSLRVNFDSPGKTIMAGRGTTSEPSSPTKSRREHRRFLPGQGGAEQRLEWPSGLRAAGQEESASWPPKEVDRPRTGRKSRVWGVEASNQ